MHHEMIQPTHFGVIGRTCLLSLIIVVSVMSLI
jgi:hypothetical protein